MANIISYRLLQTSNVADVSFFQSLLFASVFTNFNDYLYFKYFKCLFLRINPNTALLSL